MEFIDLKFFVTVAEYLHFGRAAEALYCTTSHVSHRIRKLERVLGVKLFDRTTRTVRLTARGELLLVEAKAILAGVEGMRRIAGETDDLPGVELVYSPASSALITRCLAALAETDPEAPRIRLDPRATSNDVIEAVTNGEYALGISQSLSNEVDSVQIGANKLALYVPLGHPLSIVDRATAEDLDREHLLIVSPEVSAALNREIQHFFTVREIYPHFDARRITAPDNYLDLVATHQGVAITLDSLPARPDVHKLEIIGPTPPISNIYLVWRPGRRPALVDAIVDAADRTRLETPSLAVATSS
jgi:DNA-binding transcriptional LysR family regulator